MGAAIVTPIIVVSTPCWRVSGHIGAVGKEAQTANLRSLEAPQQKLI
jgi:hypothetical protein